MRHTEGPRDASDNPRLPVQLHKPAPILQRYIQFYVQRELSLRDPQVVQSVPARAMPMLEFVFGDPIKIWYPESSVMETSPRAAVVGMLTRPRGELRLQGTLQSFVIMFWPVGLSELFRVDLRELTDQAHDVHTVVGKPISELEGRLGDCNSFLSRVRVADAFLSRRVPDPSSIDHLEDAVASILASNGKVRTSDLAHHSGMSTRQFERVFGARFGMRPKLFSRIVRFQAALDSKSRSSTKSWTDVAHEFGYHDQMHMVHDFEEFTGATPTKTLRLVEMLYRQQIEAIRIGMGRTDPRFVPRFVV